MPARLHATRALSHQGDELKALSLAEESSVLVAALPVLVSKAGLDTSSHSGSHATGGTTSTVKAGSQLSLGAAAQAGRRTSTWSGSMRLQLNCDEARAASHADRALQLTAEKEETPGQPGPSSRIGSHVSHGGWPYGQMPQGPRWWC